MKGKEDHLQEEKVNSIWRSKVLSALLLQPRLTHITFQVPRSQIALLRFILEGYDHLATLTVLDAQKGLIKMQFPPQEEQTIREILSDFQVVYINGFKTTLLEKVEDIVEK